MGCVGITAHVPSNVLLLLVDVQCGKQVAPWVVVSCGPCMREYMIAPLVSHALTPHCDWPAACRGLPLTAQGHAPNTLVRTSLKLSPDGAVKQLSNTEIFEVLITLLLHDCHMTVT